MAQSSGILHEATKRMMKRDFTRDFGEPSRIGSPAPTFPLDGQGGRSKVELAGNNSRSDPSKAKGFSLIPQEPLAELAHVYELGAKKYTPRGWEKGMPFSEIVDGLYRHMGKWLKGETHDQDDGQHHLASVAWRAFALMEYERTHPEMDDLKRPGAQGGGLSAEDQARLDSFKENLAQRGFDSALSA